MAKIKRISKIFIVVLLLVIQELKPHMGHVISDLQNEEKLMETKAEISIITKVTLEKSVKIPEIEEETSSTSSNEGLAFMANIVKEQNVANKSLEYLIEETNSIPNGSHEQEVIIKPLEESLVNLETTMSTHDDMENTQMSVGFENHSKKPLVKESLDQSDNFQIANTTQSLIVESMISNFTDFEKEAVSLPTSEKKKKEEVIINLLDESTTSSNECNVTTTESDKQIPTILVKESNNLLKDRMKERSPMISIKIPINSLSKILKFLTKDPEQDVILKPTALRNQLPDFALSNEKITPTYEKEEDLMLKEVTAFTNNHEFVTKSAEPPKEEFNLKSENFANQPLSSNVEDLSINPEKMQKTNKNPTESLVQILASPSSSSESEELEKSRIKSRTELEDYAVKQMNFILDHILLESQEFVAEVLQATGNRIFQRDHLKRYAEILNSLLNPYQLDSDYSDEVFDANQITPDDLYEEMLKKLNFLKSTATKQLYRHLPPDWVKDYKDKREELKIWLNKASAEMHRELNLYLDDEEDHIKYLYFNEAFDDISRATEIHQKLALLADLIKIVKNKKQITFMDLYMQ